MNDNHVVWARRFDRPGEDPLAVQDEVSAEVAAQIDPVMLMIEARRGAMTRGTAPGTDPSAYELILLAVPHITRLERTGFIRAGLHLERAVTSFPDHADAHKWYAVWHSPLISQHWTADPREARARATRLADRATALDPYSAGAFSVAGHVRATEQHRPLEAAALHRRALELNPNFAGGWALSAVTQAFLGHLEVAERDWHRFRTLSPFDPLGFLYEGLFAIVHVLKRDHETGVAVGRAVTELNPGYSAGYKPYLAALGHLGRTREAATVLRRLMSIEPGLTVERCLAGFPLERQADRDVFAEGLRLAGLA